MQQETGKTHSSYICSDAKYDEQLKTTGLGIRKYTEPQNRL